MPSMRVRGSWPTMFTILLLFFFASVVHSANSTAPYPAKGTAPSCNAKLKSTLKITEIPNPHRVRRTDKPPGGNPGHIAPRCSVKTNSTIKITEIPDPHRVVRREEKLPGENGGRVAPRCKAKFSSTVSAGNATNATAIKVGRIRRADKPPGGASLSSGSGRSSPGHASEGSGGGKSSLEGASVGSGGSGHLPGGASGSGGSDKGEFAVQSDFPTAPSTPELKAIDLAPYISQGALAAAYMRVSDEEIAADLVKKGKLKSGERIASQFTDHSAFKSSGWEENDALEILQGEAFDWYVPFPDALLSLGISNKARPEGKLDYTVYVHTIPWVRNGQSMKPAGRDATFQYVTTAEDACIIMTVMYATQYQIELQGLTGIESPPLSHSSDIVFLEWKRACDKTRTDLKSLKHIFISVVVTPETRNIVATILKDMGKPITDSADVWANQLPGWAQKLTFKPDSDEGKAMFGTVQLKGIMWMLVQHREHLGHKAIKSVSIFRGGPPESDYGPVFGPTFYIELEDVQSGAGPSGAGPSGSGQSKPGQSKSGRS